MKKIITLILSIALLTLAVLSLAGCGTSKNSDVVKVINIPLTEEEYAFGVDKNQPELLKEVHI